MVVTGAHECVSRVQFTVADKAYDLKLEAVRPPQDECDFKGKSTKVTVIVRNAGTMPIGPEAEISLKRYLCLWAYRHSSRIAHDNGNLR